MIFTIDDLQTIQDLHVRGDDFFLGEFDAYVFQYTLLQIGIHCVYSSKHVIISIYEDTEEWQANRAREVLQRYGISIDLLKQIRGIARHYLEN